MTVALLLVAIPVAVIALWSVGFFIWNESIVMYRRVRTGRDRNQL